jgi:general secretion pathway protein D
MNRFLKSISRTYLIAVFAAAALFGQERPPQQQPPQQNPPLPLNQQFRPAPLNPATMPQQAPPPPAPVTLAPPQPAATPQVAATPAQPPAAPDPNANIDLHLNNADLMMVVDAIARELRMNWVADPAVKGTVTINTMGDLKRSDLLPLLITVLRVNGATAVESGGLWRIMPIKDANHAAISPSLDARKFPVDDRVMLDVIPLHFASAVDLSHLLTNYLSDAGSIVVHEAGNILLITDTSRSLERLVELIGLFDSDAFAGQRVQLFSAKNSTADALALDLQTVFAAYALSGKSPIQFLPVERLNGVLVISANPASFPEVAKWVEKLDVVTRSGGLRNYVYKVQNAKAEDIAGVLTQLYGGFGSARSNSNAGRGASLPNAAPGMGNTGMGNTGMGNTGMGNTGAGFGTGGGGFQSQMAQPMSSSSQGGGGLSSGASPTRLAGTRQANGNQQEYMGPRIVPDVVNNMILVQCTPQEWEDIKATLKELDILPRQVLIEAKVFEVDLTGELDMGVTAFLQARSNASKQFSGSFAPGSSGTPVLSGATGFVVGGSRELLAFLTAVENRSRIKVISAPSVLASDNQSAHIEVGTSIPILTSVGYTGAQQTGGGSIFTNSISQQETGVILSVTPRVNEGGMVSMTISQQVSVPGPPPSTAIPSPTIQNREVDTQVSVEDGQTIALGGIIQETRTLTTNRIPLLGDIPWLGVLFGSTSTSRTRTELIVLVTPHVIRTRHEADQMTEDLKHTIKLAAKVLTEIPVEMPSKPEKPK